MQSRPGRFNAGLHAISMITAACILALGFEPLAVRSQSIQASYEEKYDRYLQGEGFSGTTSTSWSGSAWQGDRIHQQVAIWSDAALNGLTYNISGLSSVGGTIPASSIQIRPLEYVKGDLQPFSCSANHNLPIFVADALSETPVSSLSASVPRRFWITIDVPAGTPKGNYSGQMQIDGAGASPISLDLAVDVQDVELPPVSNWDFHLDLWQHPNQGLIQYNAQASPGQQYEVYSHEHVDMLEPFYRRLADNGQKAISVQIKDQALGQPPMVKWTKHTNNTWSYDFTNFDRFVEATESWGISEQINAFSPIGWNSSEIPYFDEASGTYQTLNAPVSSNPSSTYSVRWNDFLTDFRTHLQTKGWFDKTVLYMDETSTSDTQAVISVVHGHDSNWKLGLAYSHLPSQSVFGDLYDASGILEAAATDPNPNSPSEIRTFYTSCTQTHPNSYVTPQNNPAEMVWLAWHAAAKDYDGYLRWAFDNWKQSDPLDAQDGGFTAGDFALVYRSSNDSTMQPIDSIRLAALREGIQNFEKIQLLRSGSLGALPQDITLLNRMVEEFADLSSGKTSGHAQPLVQTAQNVLEYVSARASTGLGPGVTILDHVDLSTQPITGPTPTWMAYNGVGAPGSFHGFGSGDNATAGAAFDEGIWMYPFDNGNPTFETPLLATVKTLDPVDQFHTDDFDTLTFEWELISGQTAGVHFVLNVDGTWYLNNELTFGTGDSFVGALDGTPGSLVFDPNAANWTILQLTGTPDPSGTPNDDTITVGAAAGSDLFGTVMGYGFFNELADLGATTGIDIISVTITGENALINADFDGNNRVDGMDFLILQRGYGLTGQADNSNGDADRNGVVDSNDIAIWELQYGSTIELHSSVATVPEPHSLVLVVLGALSLSRRKRKLV